MQHDVGGIINDSFHHSEEVFAHVWFFFESSEKGVIGFEKLNAVVEDSFQNGGQVLRVAGVLIENSHRDLQKVEVGRNGVFLEVLQPAI